VAEIGGEFHRVVVGDAEVTGFVFVAEVVFVGEDWVGGRVVRMEALASAPIGEGCR
jgi:hypothetical protein